MIELAKARRKWLGDAHRRSRLCAQRGGDQNLRVVRFWIITMLLVLFGLSTLKLR
ncbi:MAG: hypothetical protein JNK75_02660 [Betaproteobacteria bacterium]|nr:hypothetical protein [Betaproteobacteria bacterium]